MARRHHTVATRELLRFGDSSGTVSRRRLDGGGPLSVRSLIAWTALLVYRVLGTWMLASGLGLLVATFAISPFRDSDFAPWIERISGLSIRSGIVLLVAVAAAFRLMPSQREIVRQISRDPPPPWPLVPALAVLLLLTVLQVPLLGTWLADTNSAMNQLLETAPDPPGLSLIPRALAFLQPLLAAGVLLASVTASVLGVTARANTTVGALAACACLQGGLTANSFYLRSEFSDLGTALVAAIQASGDSAGPLAALLARHDAAAGQMNVRLGIILVGYLVVLAIHARGRGTPELESTGAAQSPIETPAIRTIASHTTVSVASGVFDRSSYVVRPRLTFAESVLGRKYAEYEIESIPASADHRFLLSWTTGTLRRLPDGPDVLTLSPRERPARMLRRTYTVTDAATGRPLGSLVPKGRDWEIVNDLGSLLAEVVERQSGYASAVYVLKADGIDVCQYRWMLGGMTVLSAHLDVEFSSGTRVVFDKGLALAIAPILEQRARLTSEWSA